MSRRAVVLGGALVAAVAAFVFGRALGTRTNYDEGVYLASLRLLRDGQELGADIYTPQPPVFYWLLELLALPFDDSVVGIRAGFVALAVVGVVAAFAAANSLYGLAAGLGAGLFLVIGPPYPSVSPTVAADVPSLSLGLIALALVARAVTSEAPRRWSTAAGAVAALAVLTKFLAAPFLVPLLVLPLARRMGRRVIPYVVAGGVTATALVLLVHAGSLGELWAGAVSDHEGAKALSRYGDNVDRLRWLLEWRTPFGWLVPAAGVAFLLSRNARRTWPLATLLPAAALFTIYVRPLPDHQLSLMACAYAVAAGPALALGVGQLRARPQRLATIAIVLLIAAGVFQEQRRQTRNDVSEPAHVTWAANALDVATAPGTMIVTDLPSVAFYAERSIPGFLTDTSATRVRSHALLPHDVLREIDHNGVTAVVVSRMFRSLPAVVAGVAARLPVTMRCGDATLYLRAKPARPLPSCPPE